jgi:hypothetical protein
VLSRSRKHELLNSVGCALVLPQVDEASWSKPTLVGVIEVQRLPDGPAPARSVMLSATMIPTNAAIFGLVVVAVLACLALDRAVAKRRQARIKKQSEESAFLS